MHFIKTIFDELILILINKFVKIKKLNNFKNFFRRQIYLN